MRLKHTLSAVGFALCAACSGEQPANTSELNLEAVSNQTASKPIPKADIALGETGAGEAFDVFVELCLGENIMNGPAIFDQARSSGFKGKHTLRKITTPEKSFDLYSGLARSKGVHKEACKISLILEDRGDAIGFECTTKAITGCIEGGTERPLSETLVTKFAEAGFVYNEGLTAQLRRKTNKDLWYVYDIPGREIPPLHMRFETTENGSKGTFRTYGPAAHDFEGADVKIVEETYDK